MEGSGTVSSNAVRLVTGGKWHAQALGGGKTACGTRIPMTAAQKHVDLVDSSERCRDPKCVKQREVFR